MNILDVMTANEGYCARHTDTPLAQALNARTKAIVINSPNNPSGAVYSEQTIRRLAGLLAEKEEQYGHPIYLVSDEPYREIIYDGIETPFVPQYYELSLIHISEPTRPY